MLIALAVYAAIAILVLLWGLSEAAREPTAHGQAILFPFMIVLAALWPVALVYALVIAIIAGAGWVGRKVGLIE